MNMMMRANGKSGFELAEPTGSRLSSRLAGKVVLVTGGGGAIGAEIVNQCCLHGGIVSFCDVGVEQGNKTVQTVREGCPEAEVEFVRVCLTKEDEVKSWIDGVAKKWGKIDVLVNNAAIFCFSSVDTTTVEDWTKGSALTSKYAIPYMKEAKAGSIIHMGSISSHIGQEKMAPYSTSKGALLELTRCMACDLGPDNIRVNCLCPGFIRTPASENHAKSMGLAFDDFVDSEKKKWFIPRVGSPVDVANAVIFLGSDESTFITGSSLMVDGGYVAK